MSAIDLLNEANMPTEWVLNKASVDTWIAEHKYPTPTGFALDFELTPEDLPQLATDDEVVRYAMFRLLEYGEKNIMFKVYGSRNYIQRIEGILFGKGSFDKKELDGDDDGLFVSA